MSPSSAEYPDDYSTADLDNSPAAHPPRPINWNLLPAAEAAPEWLDLDRWVSWLRTTFGLPAAVLPPAWHRHDELIWELSALHTHFLYCYDPNSPPSAPLLWMRDFADARHRLREWVSTCGTRLDRDRPTHQTVWPGELHLPAGEEAPITDRAHDFAEFVREDLTARLRIEAMDTEQST
jgi:hypothetical protein